MADEKENAARSKLAASVWLIVGGTLYAIGFLVVTFHLAKYGVTTLVLLRPQYLVAGIWCIIPLLIFSAGLAMGVLNYAEPFLDSPHAVPKSVRGMRHVFGFVQGAGGFGVGFVLVSVAIAKGLYICRQGPAFSFHLSSAVTRLGWHW